MGLTHSMQRLLSFKAQEHRHFRICSNRAMSVFIHPIGVFFEKLGGTKDEEEEALAEYPFDRVSVIFSGFFPLPFL